MSRSTNDLERCLSVTRRRWLQIGAISLTGIGPIGAVRGAIETTIEPVQACILVFYQGGPSHLDTWDMKPNAPAEVRGEFKSISTSVPGLATCEHLPHLARV